VIKLETCRIYLSGGMSSLDFEEQTKWRKQITNSILFGDYNYEKKPIFFNPVDYYDFKEKRHKTEREIVEFDLNSVRKSDIIIVNFNDPNSIGTCAELAIAYNMRIPIIGINKDNVELHPWLVEFTTRMCDSIREAVDYVVDFYLN
jgi:nucleoside 2-deoxyribosyltransferase